MPKLAPELAAKAEDAACPHEPITERSEPEVGFVGRSYCQLCGTTLAVDPTYGSAWPAKRWRAPA